MKLTFRSVNAAFPLVSWPLLLLYLAVPFVVGATIGKWARKPDDRKRHSFARVFTGRNPEPLAWDELFTQQLGGYIRVQLKDEKWYVGSLRYASSYPEAQDLTLDAIAADDRGVIKLNPEGAVVKTHWTMHLKREDCNQIQFQRFEEVK